MRRFRLQNVHRAALTLQRATVQTDELARFAVVRDGGLLLPVRPQHVVGDDAVVARELSGEEGGMPRRGFGDGVRIRHFLEVLALATQARETAVVGQPIQAFTQNPRGKLINYDGDRDGGVLHARRGRDWARSRQGRGKRGFGRAGDGSSRRHPSVRGCGSLDGFGLGQWPGREQEKEQDKIHG